MDGRKEERERCDPHSRAWSIYRRKCPNWQAAGREQQHCTGTLLLVLHLLHLPFSLSFASACHFVLLSSFTSQNWSSNTSSLFLLPFLHPFPHLLPPPHPLSSNSYPSSSTEDLHLCTSFFITQLHSWSPPSFFHLQLFSSIPFFSQDA